MDPFPHLYRVDGSAEAGQDILLQSEGVSDIRSHAPKEFGGPGTEWSPETLLVASVGDCYILTFKALAAASKLEWTRISCNTVGKLDRVERVNRFTQFDLEVELQVPADASDAMAERLMKKAKEVCLITNSLNAECVLTTRLTKS